MSWKKSENRKISRKKYKVRRDLNIFTSLSEKTWDIF